MLLRPTALRMVVSIVVSVSTVNWNHLYAYYLVPVRALAYSVNGCAKSSNGRVDFRPADTVCLHGLSVQVGINLLSQQSLKQSVGSHRLCCN